MAQWPDPVCAAGVAGAADGADLARADQYLFSRASPALASPAPSGFTSPAPWYETALRSSPSRETRYATLAPLCPLRSSTTTSSWFATLTLNVLIWCPCLVRSCLTSVPSWGLVRPKAVDTLGG